VKKIILVVTFVSSLFLVGCGQDLDAQWIENKYTSSASKFIPIDGNRIHYRDEGQGEVIVLLHGTASSLHTWDQWVEVLAENYRVIRFDLPGFGLSGPDHAKRYEVQDDVELIRHLLQKLNIKTAHFAGSSLGGRIAWQYALQNRTNVKSLLLMNALGYEQKAWPPAIEMAHWPLIDEVMKRFSPRVMYELGLKDVYHNSALVTEQLVDRYFELSRYPGNLEAFPDRVQARLDKDALLIKKVAVPTLVQWGREDLYFPVENAYLFAKDIDGAVLQVYDNVGHLPMEELPTGSVNDYQSFLRSLKVSNEVNAFGSSPSSSDGQGGRS
jgi:pimeloyl-ACP methyl ester carboxylesterase